MKNTSWVRTGILALVACCFSAPSAYAGDDVFIVARVPVQAEADSATRAKAIAQDRGRRRAMGILLRRITPENDWVYHPDLFNNRGGDVSLAENVAGEQTLSDDADSILPLADQTKRPIELSPSELVSLEESFEIYDEKSSSRFYRAYITYRFKPDAVRGLLKKATLPYSEAQTRTALVLPVLQTDRGVYLWEEKNPWMAAWRSRPYTHELTPMIAPLGDLQDATSVSARGALRLNASGMAKLAERYGVSQIIVAHARLRQSQSEEGNRDQVYVRLINAYRDSATANATDVLLAERLDSEQAELSVDNLEARSSQDEDLAAEVGDVIGEAYLAKPSGNFPQLAERVIDVVISRYSSAWKQMTLIDHASDAVLGVTAFFDSLEDWSRIRNGLVATPLVGSVQISALSPRGSEMEVRVFGDPERLQVSLGNQGIVFWTENGGRWFLATPAVAARMRGQQFLSEGRYRRSEFVPASYSDKDNNSDLTLPTGVAAGVATGAMELKRDRP